MTLTRALLERYLRAIKQPVRPGEDLSAVHIEVAIDRLSSWLGIGYGELAFRLGLCAAAEDALCDAKTNYDIGTQGYRALTMKADYWLRAAGIDPAAWETCTMSDIQWQPISTAPKDATEIRVQMADGSVIERAHWASDLNGEEQPPFQGWFRPVIDSTGRVLYYAGIAEPIGWAAR